MNNIANVVKVIRVGGFIARLFGYAFFYVPFYLIVIWLILMSDAEWTKSGLTGTVYIDSLIPIFITMLPFILWEMSIRRFRRKHGLSVWKNIEEDLEQMVVDERVGRGQKAHQTISKTDISYWHKLLKDGAITQEEYTVKKKELL